ncbi:MAG: hypothetical protein IPM24_16705 [Bryobacterales bacterium]|nr:hypothetical protein [Bryobacterales bacterium]
MEPLLAFPASGLLCGQPFTLTQDILRQEPGGPVRPVARAITGVRTAGVTATRIFDLRRPAEPPGAHQRPAAAGPILPGLCGPDAFGGSFTVDLHPEPAAVLGFAVQKQVSRKQRGAMTVVRERLVAPDLGCAELESALSVFDSSGALVESTVVRAIELVPGEPDAALFAAPVSRGIWSVRPQGRPGASP